MTGDGVVGDTETALVVRLMERHVNPSTVLLGPLLVCFPGPFLEEGVADLPIDMLLLEAVLIRLVYLAVEVLKAGSLAKSKELVVDEAILDVVDVIHNCLTLILHKMLDKGISADGNPKANVAINHKARRREQRTEVIEGGIGSEHAHGGSVRVGRRDTLDEKLGLQSRVCSKVYPCGRGVGLCVVHLKGSGAGRSVRSARGRTPAAWLGASVWSVSARASCTKAGPGPQQCHV